VETSFAEALPQTEQFLSRGWVEEQPISLEQYLKRTGAASVSAIGAAIPPAVVLHAPRSEEAVPVPPEMPVAMSTPPPLTAASPLPAAPLRLGSVVDFIVEQGHNVALGQITVYRVFLRVPPALLQEEDIVSVHLVNDPTLVKSAPLKQAIAEAVLEVMKKPLPASVFAAA
jgi:hypothetical protein